MDTNNIKFEKRKNIFLSAFEEVCNKYCEGEFSIPDYEKNIFSLLYYGNSSIINDLYLVAEGEKRLLKVNVLQLYSFIDPITITQVIFETTPSICQLNKTQIMKLVNDLLIVSHTKDFNYAKNLLVYSKIVYYDDFEYKLIENYI